MSKETTPHKSLRAAKNKNGKILYVPRTWDQYQVWHLPDSYNFFEESKDIQEDILFEVAEGKTLTGACKIHGMPVSLVLLMAEKDKDFDKALRTAMSFRAETYHDKYANIAEEVTESTAKSAKVKADILRNLMAIGNQEKFGEKKKVVQEASTTVTFLVDTGIRRGDIIEHGPAREIPGESVSGANERLLAVDGIAEPERVRVVQPEQTSGACASGGMDALGGGDSGGQERSPSLRQSAVCEPEPPLSGDESGQREGHDREGSQGD